ncbi:hypothetical protein ANAPRD1_00497 [Anaplasma phagocytophilum]|nr:hypothetical protein ANAPH1_00352 [Anaplasma phagocytophilum]SCV63850.1 hypothetical protein ANAPRD1_00497 [Anaplasma phagocytophilum]SCV64511.1 hypothetical protein ANAPH2_00981 [Anaplasma phagocytophilum]
MLHWLLLFQDKKCFAIYGKCLPNIKRIGGFDVEMGRVLFVGGVW